MVDMAHRGAFRPLEGAPAIQRLLSPVNAWESSGRRLFPLSSFGSMGDGGRLGESWGGETGGNGGEATLLAEVERESQPLK